VGLLQVPLVAGLVSRVEGDASQADLLKIADTLRIDPNPDLRWPRTR
jgi:hypothetical protein